MAYYIKIFFLTLKVFHCYPSFNSLLYSLKRILNTNTTQHQQKSMKIYQNRQSFTSFNNSNHSRVCMIPYFFHYIRTPFSHKKIVVVAYT